jgi:G6PDH family F420-dependent oxidoreductase
VSVDRARVRDVPAEPPALAVAAGGPKVARMAGEKGAGLFTTEPDRELVRAWSAGGGRGPRYAEVTIGWAREEAAAIAIAHERFRFGLFGWDVLAELPGVASFEDAASSIRGEDVARAISCGPERHAVRVRECVEAGYDHIVLVAPGPDQEGFLGFWKDELGPRLRRP